MYDFIHRQSGPVPCIEITIEAADCNSSDESLDDWYYELLTEGIEVDNKYGLKIRISTFSEERPPLEGMAYLN